MMHPITSALLLLLAFGGCLANVLMHNPRGSNNRNCDNANNPNNENRENRFRLFDSQNNDKGGYSCPRAWPYPCHTIRNNTDRGLCNEWNVAEVDTGEALPSGVADDHGVLDARGTRTNKMYYYQGSELELQWTVLHGCGGENPRVNCDILLQYACEDTLSDDCGQPGSGVTCAPRDGVPVLNSVVDRGSAVYESLLPTGGDYLINRFNRDTQATETIPVSTNFSAQSDLRFGRHEGLSYYARCYWRSRNMGLWTADRTLATNTSTSTRQNYASTRFGLECAEERDYWPYWGSSPWKDIALLTSSPERCAQISQSQNTVSKWECVCASCLAPVPIDEAACVTATGTWTEFASFNLSAPFCGNATTAVVNSMTTAKYKWIVPAHSTDLDTCVLRIRYNITTNEAFGGVVISVDGTSAQDGANSPIVSHDINPGGSEFFFSEYPSPSNYSLSINLDASQYGSVFQDRSYAFSMIRPPSTGSCAGKMIYNLNVLGKRGNVVETFPAMQSNFAPSELYVSVNDCVHIQWTGSDYNPAANDNNAYGGPASPQNLDNGRADRHNLVQTYFAQANFPVASLDVDWNMFAIDRAAKLNLAFIGQDLDNSSICTSIEKILNMSYHADLQGDSTYIDQNGNNYMDLNNDRDRWYQNCGKLSGAASPYFDGGLFVPAASGAFSYMNTRVNSFSNRQMIGLMFVAPTTETSTGTPTGAPTLSPKSERTSSAATLNANGSVSLMAFVILSWGLQ